ncbi:MAG: TetR/AcrR family transcriptional regulator [Bacteroidales bacterium]|nr:TetR/AcrR family transcriptional regulator [Bacteroidales bacterium]
MADNDVTTENKILEAANSVFLLYGYHGTRLHQIADLAGIHKSAVHYYFRSKEILYGKVVSFVIENILTENNKFTTNQKLKEVHLWFIFTELYNNKNLFENVLKELYIVDWSEKLTELKKVLEIKIATPQS